jgi:bifunctional enzyme Fae/Hps
VILVNHQRYLQIAFNYDRGMVTRLLPRIPYNERILIEAGTPFIKREGLAGIRIMRALWKGLLVADLKVADGALGEVEMVHQAGANAVTVLGSAPKESLDLFIAACGRLNLISMVDMLGVEDPLAVLRPLKKPPEVVVLHKGRDEESSRNKLIQYRHINRLRSKYDVLISAAGGIDAKQARSAIFNGANIVVANIVDPDDEWVGIPATADISGLAYSFLSSIE